MTTALASSSCDSTLHNSPITSSQSRVPIESYPPEDFKVRAQERPSPSVPIFFGLHLTMKTSWVLIGGLGWLSGMAFSQTPIGDTVCKGVAMDWYTLTVKETSCRTYERLRQTCNSSYTVGEQTVHGSTSQGAPDACTDQNSACCCNYIAFALSMLCLNCQQDVGSLLVGGTGGAGEDTGFIAGAGSFHLYLTNFGQSPQCAPQLNTSFPQNVQQQVCLEGLNIDDNLYSASNFSPDGSWISTNVMHNMQQSMASPNYTFNKCTDLNIKATTTASSLSTNTDIPPSQISAALSSLPSPPALPTGVIVGISVAATLVQRHMNLCEIEQPNTVTNRIAGIIHQFELPPRSNGNEGTDTCNHCYERVDESIVVPSASLDPPPTFVSRPQDPEPAPDPPEQNTRTRRQRFKRRQGPVNVREPPDDADNYRNQDGAPLLGRLGSSASGGLPPPYQHPPRS
ncbi:hypothetical protein SISNIDRAFT_483087 [Sistotremastrum niveocremeum HHB9708]|uniref:Uncharacterized protein n=1 Tax=Sistotremastrum niveocremeum HHB9708 TaxID=1314777 RepID=A0A164Y2Z5_9AGAM|nr:hypothetical protein SISNIDRAFT_483087 [Sistotremastrum niveocremeum HHB9708]